MSLPNSSFHPSIPGLQIAWDSTSLGTFKTCPRKYQLSIIEGWTPRRTSVHLIFGLHYHKALERYDHSRSQGVPHEQAAIDAVRQALSDTWERPKDGSRGGPWLSDDQYKNRLTLVRTVVWYLDHFSEDTVQTVQLANGRPAVELSFRFASDFTTQDGEPFIICGHLDRLGDYNGQTYVLDRKTTKSTISQNWFNDFTPHNQFSLYCFAAKVIYRHEVKGLIVDGAQIAVGFSRFERAIIPRTETQLEEWWQELGMTLKLAEYYAHAGHWPMNDTACGNYGGCPFREVCSKPPGIRQKWLEGMFVKRVWDPLQVRGDI